MPDPIFEQWKNEGARSHEIFTYLIQKKFIKVNTWTNVTKDYVEAKLSEGWDLLPHEELVDEPVRHEPGRYEPTYGMRPTGYYTWQKCTA